VFREDSTGAPPPAPAAPSQAQWHETRTADPVLLFRYSALTFNSHRIHYDRSYATGVEGYPGIVVQGPLLATLLAEALCRSAQRAPSSVSFRAVSPLFAGSPFRLGGNATSAWAASADGRLAMSAEMELA
jgi:3-methylfumaryl-CoA hydratase